MPVHLHVRRFSHTEIFPISSSVCKCRNSDHPGQDYVRVLAQSPRKSAYKAALPTPGRILPDHSISAVAVTQCRGLAFMIIHLGALNPAHWVMDRFGLAGVAKQVRQRRQLSADGTKGQALALEVFLAGDQVDAADLALLLGASGA